VEKNCEIATILDLATGKISYLNYYGPEGSVVHI